MSRPRTKKQLRRFLGMAVYYSRFIPKFAEIACPHRDRLAKGHSEILLWDPDAEQAMRRLKTALCSFPVLYSPDLNGCFSYRPMHLTTQWSPFYHRPCQMENIR